MVSLGISKSKRNTFRSWPLPTTSAQSFCAARPPMRCGRASAALHPLWSINRVQRLNGRHHMSLNKFMRCTASVTTRCIRVVGHRSQVTYTGVLSRDAVKCLIYRLYADFLLAGVSERFQATLHLHHHYHQLIVNRSLWFLVLSRLHHFHCTNQQRIINGHWRMSDPSNAGRSYGSSPSINI